jgi:hypothetical protein
MRVRVSAFILFFLISFLPLPSHAARFSGEYLLGMCASDKNGKELVPGGHIACQAYIAGVLDYHTLLSSLGTPPAIDFCVPDTVTMNTLQKKVESYIFYNKREHMGFIAAPGVAMGLYSYYPCKKNRK